MGKDSYLHKSTEFPPESLVPKIVRNDYHVRMTITYQFSGSELISSVEPSVVFAEVFDD